ncbi:MAG: hypothetical protein U0361_01990 [Nitrospiraceae bacterium]
MINVIKALDYADVDQINESLVEARANRCRLNVLSDKVTDKAAYREDAFARYLTRAL